MVDFEPTEDWPHTVVVKKEEPKESRFFQFIKALAAKLSREQKEDLLTERIFELETDNVLLRLENEALKTMMRLHDKADLKRLLGELELNKGSG